MKAIIDGLRYNTETATDLGGKSWGYRGDFHHWSASLYRTKSGRYFLAGEGGGLSRFARYTGNGTERTSGWKIIPMDAEEALDWAERNLTTAEVEAAFGGAVEEA